MENERRWFYMVGDKRIRGPISEGSLLEFSKAPSSDQPIFVWKAGTQDKVSFKDFLRTHNADATRGEIEEVFNKSRTSAGSKIPKTSWMGSAFIPSVDSHTSIYGAVTLMMVLSILGFLGYGIYEGYLSQRHEVRRQEIIKEQQESRKARETQLIGKLKDRDRYLGTRFVSIPANKYGRIGCNWAYCENNELPFTKVAYKAFQIQAHEVTLAQWDLCVEEKGCSETKNSATTDRTKTPVTNVSHFEITTEFLPWLNQKGFGTYRLPTEVEWEAAAKAGNNREPFHWGRSFDYEKALIFSAREKALFKKTGEYNLTIMQFPPNQFDVYDMHGSVSEWTSDCSTRSYKAYKSLRATNKPITYSGCQGITVRGSSWYDEPNDVNVFTRRFYRHDMKAKVLGFRLVMDDMPEV